MSRPRNILLIGYRGTGKTTVGKLLADRLRWNYVDADAYLERKYGRTIRDIFHREGEAGFRDKETAVLEELCEGEHQVIATGGGVVLRPENRERLRGSGTVAWLAADAGTIHERLQADAATPEQRPPLTAAGGLAEIEGLLALREPFYRECAHLAVQTAGRAPEDVAQCILQQLQLEAP